MEEEKAKKPLSSPEDFFGKVKKPIEKNNEQNKEEKKEDNK